MKRKSFFNDWRQGFLQNCWGVFPRLLGKQTNLEVEKHFKCDGLHLTPARALSKVEGVNSSESYNMQSAV